MARQLAGTVGTEGTLGTLPSTAPSTSAPVRLVEEPGSARRRPDALPAGTEAVGKFPLTTADLVVGETAPAWTKDETRFLPFVPATVKSAPAAMSEAGSYDARAESAPKPDAPNPVARARTPSVPPGSPEDETRNLSGLSFSFL